ncbi:HK97 family phage prohead protease [Listeria booriae]|uniref:HK97 family phage prohead protease n=1 Tax=Listeria booriae TaxID=1552123 RepID=A0A841Y8X7_9LIST|nr:HK97 family phage prohead protease [Listeria booriae]MBC1373367.1 HK97 family phage prohead protease [Listeria booriae]MBC1524122.1 HK97 family phage prohead protease [Listeria booriae]MBC2067020.1 HK97 family phage prohead protease [Listeria booriae]MBC2389066.1 HK97 family phage prohead protease [Listeria booriae]MBC6133917.1 HK97 family phage prohead protease [Listeria booriae]
MNEETRSLQGASTDVDGEKEMVIQGYALKFNSLSEDLGGFRELILSTAMDNVDLSDVRCLVNHDRNLCIGRTKADTLKLNVDQTGLWFECSLPATSYAKDLYENMKAGNIDQCSFKFFLSEGGASWKRDKDGGYVRSIHKFSKIEEISIVTIPAYEGTNVEVASRDLKVAADREKELVKIELNLINAYV